MVNTDTRRATHFDAQCKYLGLRYTLSVSLTVTLLCTMFADVSHFTLWSDVVVPQLVVEIQSNFLQNLIYGIVRALLGQMTTYF